jgi:hypothetical protein
MSIRAFVGRKRQILNYTYMLLFLRHLQNPQLIRKPVFQRFHWKTVPQRLRCFF